MNLVTQLLWADMRQSPGSIEPSQWVTLRHIARGPCTIGELARHKAVSLPTMSKSVEMLVRRAWVERVVDEIDRRRTLVRLTASGRRVLADSRRRSEDLLAQKLGTLTAFERDALAASLRRVRAALAAPPTASVPSSPTARGQRRPPASRPA